MTGMHKITEAFNIAATQAENDRLKKSVKALLRLLTSQTVTCSGLRRKNIELEQHCHMLWGMIIEPDPPRWHLYCLAFACGMVAMSVIAGVIVSL